jgi:hypothetical protein
MCETMQSSHRLRPAMALVRALLAPTASGDGAGERFCAPLPPSPHFSGACPEDLTNFFFFLENSSIFALLGGPQVEGKEVTVESGGNFEDYKLVYIRFLSCHLFGPVNHGQTWKGWERSGDKGLIINDNQPQTWLIITINDTSIGDLPLIITISDTCKNQPKRLDFDNTINLSSLIVILDM